MRKFIEFDTDDVQAVAEALLEDSVEYEDGDYGPWGYRCLYCNGFSQDKPEKIQHETSCVVLVARDLLTRVDDDE